MWASILPFACWVHPLTSLSGIITQLMERQFESREHLEYTNFAQAVDQYFSKLEVQKIDAKLAQQVSFSQRAYLLSGGTDALPWK